MAWIVDSREAAEAAGADMETDEVMYVITPDTVRWDFNRYMADVLGEEIDDPPDRWHELAQEERDAHMAAMWLYIDRRMGGLYQDFWDMFENTRRELERNGKAT